MGGAIRENLGYRDFTIFFTAEFSHFLVTIFLTGVLIGGEPYVKILGTGISNHGTGKKIPGAGISNPGTGKKIPGTGISNSSTENRIESSHKRENFPGASRPSKTLTGVLIGTENWLSLGGGGDFLYKIKNVKKIKICKG